MGIPKQVQKQSEEVQELYKELNGETETAQVEKTEATEVPVEQPIEQPSYSVEDQAPKSEPQEQVESDAQPKESWEQKYKTLQGMYNADVPRLNAKNREVNARVSQLEQLLGTMQQSAKPEEPVSTDPLITDADMKEYGDSIDVMRRAAREEVNTAMGGLHSWRKQFSSYKESCLKYNKYKHNNKLAVNKRFGLDLPMKYLIGKILITMQTFSLGCYLSIH